MCVAIDEAGQHGGMGEIDHARAGGHLRFEFRGRADFRDAFAFDQNDLVFEIFAGGDIQNFSGLHGDHRGLRGRWFLG